jgi:hypothetical protein
MAEIRLAPVMLFLATACFLTKLDISTIAQSLKKLACANVVRNFEARRCRRFAMLSHTSSGINLPPL